MQMTQEDILKLILANPGIELVKLKKMADVSEAAVSQSVSALVRWGQVRKAPGKNRKSDRLFPV